MKYSELKAMPVIDIDNGNRIGSVTDLEIDIMKNKVTALLVKEKQRGLGAVVSLFFPKELIMIPIEKLIRTGRDVILVRNRD